MDRARGARSNMEMAGTRQIAAALLMGALAWAGSGARASDDQPQLVLQNGAKVEAPMLKESPEGLFMDLGYDVLAVPRGAIAQLLKPTTDTGTTVGELEVEGEGWAAISRNAHAARERRSPSEVLEDAKRGVVIVSTPSGFGAGFVIDRQGHILTNQHVVLDEKFVDVTFLSQQRNRTLRKKIKEVEILALSPLFDIALLALPAESIGEVELRPLPLAPAGSLDDADAVYAIGNPGMGREILDYTLSEGIVSSLARNFDDILYIQTTASVNPGNSGGPLINAYGQVVGLVSLKAYYQEGIAFALPVEMITYFLSNEKAYAYGKANPNTGYHYLSPE